MKYIITKFKDSLTPKMFRLFSLKDSKTITWTMADSGVQNYEYRHIRMQMTEGSGTKQFSLLYFETDDGVRFIYPEDRICYNDGGTSIFYGSEVFSNTVNNSNSMAKACFGRISYSIPLSFYIDLRDKPINIKRFRNWGWYTSNDTGDLKSEHRNMRSCKLFVSNSNMTTTNIPEDEWEEVSSFRLTDYEYNTKYLVNYTKVGPYRITVKPKV